jgi:hypothetical protein
LLLAGLLLSQGVPACAAVGDAPPPGGGEPGGGGGGGGGAGGQGGSENTFVGSSGSAGSQDDVLDPGAACFSSTSEAVFMPISMFISFDDSGSMAGQKWQKSKAAMIAFFQDPGAAGLRVAFRFFGDMQDPCQACDVGACAEPMVDLGELTTDPAPADAQEAQLVAIFESTPTGGTPLGAALNGAEQWAVNHQWQNPTEKTVVVIVTDGEPSSCEPNKHVIASYAEAARLTNGVLTFAIALEGSNVLFMNEIASRGGTNQAIVISNTSDADQELLAALKGIQSGIGCEFAVPATDGHGHAVDPTRVNVSHVPGGAGEPVLVGQVPSSAACGDAGGWYYDADPPTIITLCPATCKKVKADEDAKVNLLFGCATQPLK